MSFAYDNKYKRKANESVNDYAYRICACKDEIGTWDNVGFILNMETGLNHSESYWRKNCASGFHFPDNEYYRDSYTDNSSLEIEKEKERLVLQEIKLNKEKKKFSDQKREFNKLLLKDARVENLNDKLLEAVSEINTTLPLVNFNYVDECTEREGLCCWSDWHYGMVTDNIWNKYNVEICKYRVKKLVAKTIKYINVQGIDKLSIVLLGDACHGACHVSARVKSEEDVSSQIINVTELMAEAINELSKYVNTIDVYSCYGNHLRTVQNKDDSVSSDNMEKLIPWYLKARLSQNKKITIHNSDFYEFTYINILGNNICCVHGNDKKFKDIGQIANTVFTQSFGVPINYTISGDKHHLEEFEQFNIESILVRSLCGTDDYANDRCLYSKPGQTFIIFNNEGRECTYNITL